MRSVQRLHALVPREVPQSVHGDQPQAREMCGIGLRVREVVCAWLLDLLQTLDLSTPTTALQRLLKFMSATGIAGFS